MKLAVIAFWSLTNFPLSPDAFLGPRFGWHDRNSPGPPSPLSVQDAIRVCADHNWKGYVRWRSNPLGLWDRTEQDSCAFVHAVIEEPR